MPANFGPQQTGGRLTTTDALTYLREVKARFSHDKHIYDTFLEIMKDFKAQKCVFDFSLSCYHASECPFDGCGLHTARALFVPQVRAKYGAESPSNSAHTDVCTEQRRNDC